MNSVRVNVASVFNARAVDDSVPEHYKHAVKDFLPNANWRITDVDTSGVANKLGCAKLCDVVCVVQLLSTQSAQTPTCSAFIIDNGACHLSYVVRADDIAPVASAAAQWWDRLN